MGDRVRKSCSFTQRGASALRFHLGSELGLELCVLTAIQASPLATPGCRTRRALWTPRTGACWKRDGCAWEHRPGLAPRPGALAGGEVAGEVVLRKKCPALGPGAGHDVHALLGPVPQAWAGPVPQID